MPIDLQRMLHKCETEQWRVGDLDWRRPPRPMSPDDERAIVQYFTDMAAIERLAGALFEEQRKLTDDPTLCRIFETFVVDEIRHSHCAQMLADHYDVHRYTLYQTNPSLVAFGRYFVDAVQHLSAEIANVYITCGELLLDIALLRSLDDYVDDPMSHDAMRLINRDESRHIAVDYHMCEYYASGAYDRYRSLQPREGARARARAWLALGRVLYYAGPFFEKVFFEPMALTDPGHRRLREAMKRMQLMSTRPEVAARPFVHFMRTLLDAYNSPLVQSPGGRLAARAILRITGMQEHALAIVYTPEEKAKTMRMTWAEMADDALAAKEL